MARTTPLVQAETVTWSMDRHEHQLTVGTPAWYAWLEEVSIFAFVSDMGTFTARKEPVKSGGAYWKAYRKRDRKLHHAYLGKSQDVTLQRLQRGGQRSCQGKVTRQIGGHLVTRWCRPTRLPSLRCQRT